MLNRDVIFQNIKRRLVDLGGDKRIQSMQLQIIKGEIDFISTTIALDCIKYLKTYIQSRPLSLVHSQGRDTNTYGSYVCFFIQEIINRMGDLSDFLQNTIMEHFRNMKHIETKTKVSYFKNEMSSKLSGA